MAVKSTETFQLCSLEKECNLLTKLADFPHILCCYGGFVSDDNGLPLYNIKLEYASGGSLTDRIRSSGGGLSDYEVRWCTKSILIGLSHIHKKGYVHCDIKPHNILFVGGSSSTRLLPRRERLERETVEIADFGLAKKAGKKRKFEDCVAGWKGTPLYIAPESILYREYEAWSDIWSHGCTVLEMITGKPGWKCELGTETCALLYRIGFTGQVPEVPSWVSEEAKDPKSRWTTDMLLGHLFVTSKIMMPMRESVKKKNRSSCK